MREDKVVTVIIPTYKRATSLERAIDSVLNQTYKNIQVIVVDDNNPDTESRIFTQKIMSKYSNDNRVLYIRHEKNKNGSAARNTGIRYAEGEYLCFLDDDDYFLEDKIYKQVNIMQNYPTYDACCCDYKKNGEAIILDKKDDYSIDILLLHKTPQTSGIMFSKSAILKLGGFDESYIRHQDYELLLRFFSSGYKMYKIDEILYHRDVGVNSNIPNGDDFFKVKMKLLNQFDALIISINSNRRGFKRKVYSIHYERISKNYLKEKKVIQGFIFLWKSLYYSPKTLFCALLEEVRIHV